MKAKKVLVNTSFNPSPRASPLIAATNGFSSSWNQQLFKKYITHVEYKKAIKKKKNENWYITKFWSSL